ncbi:hypothetical protein C1N32_20755 [Vibrio diazotrophicus]|uniref:Uncharacterized protein n=1 Tax=Vibrio diazotrophicus TaxID=685 RepID=A0A2J8HSC8_VIBDI|nr:hypothetical protein C1N32_20755 [Vibrio diazotrophicus]
MLNRPNITRIHGVIIPHADHFAIFTRTAAADQTQRANNHLQRLQHIIKLVLMKINKQPTKAIKVNLIPADFRKDIFHTTHH